MARRRPEISPDRCTTCFCRNREEVPPAQSTFLPSLLRFWFCWSVRLGLWAQGSRFTLPAGLPVLVRHIGPPDVRSISRNHNSWDYAFHWAWIGHFHPCPPLQRQQSIKRTVSASELCCGGDTLCLHTYRGCSAQGGPIRTKRSSAACTRCRRYRQKCVMEWVDGKAQVPCAGCVKAGRRVASSW